MRRDTVREVVLIGILSVGGVALPWSPARAACVGMLGVLAFSYFKVGQAGDDLAEATRVVVPQVKRQMSNHELLAEYQRRTFDVSEEAVLALAEHDMDRAHELSVRLADAASVYSERRA